MSPIIKNRWFIHALALLAIIIPNSFVEVSGQSPAQAKKWVVVIDAGHGGKDPGSIGATKTREKGVALAIALKTGQYIEKNMPDVEVLYTRDDDTFVGLKERAEFANSNNADFFISIHANAVKERTPKGAETWIMGQSHDDANLRLAMKENAVMTFEEDYHTKYEGYDPNSAESFIIFSAVQNTYTKQSTEFASIVQDQFRERVGRNDRGVKQGELIVLWMSTMPSVLVEVGFISNPDEEKFLNSVEGQEYMASAIFRSFRQYKNTIDSRSGILSAEQASKLVAEDKVISKDETKPRSADKGKESREEIVKPSSAGDLWFGVQISSAPRGKPAGNDSFKNIENYTAIESGERIKYIAGRYQSYEEASAYRKTITSGYPDAFVVAVRNMKIVPLREAIEEKKKTERK